MKIEEQIRELINKEYGSIRKFTMKHGFKYTTIMSVFKRGIYKSSSTTIFAICNALGIDKDKLLDEGLIVHNTGMADHEVILSLYNKLNDHDKEEIIKIIKRYIDSANGEKDEK